MDFIHFDSIDSTNSFLKKEYLNLKDATFVDASFQFNGKGREDRKWISQKGDNFLFSLLLKDEVYLKEGPKLSLFAAAVIFNALSKLNLPNLEIKWPNDIYVNNKKLVGILLEGVSKGDKLEAIIIGCGINVNSFPNNGLLKEATSINNELDQKVSVDNIKNLIYSEFEASLMSLLENKFDYMKVVNKYLYNKKKRVEAIYKNSNVDIKILRVNKDGSLLADIDNKKVNIYSGEIHFVK